MKRKHTENKNILHFCRFSRKGYAIFCGLGKQIRIGRLPVYMVQGEELKGGRINTSVVTPTVETSATLYYQDPDNPDSLLEQPSILTVAFSSPLCSAAYAGGHGNPISILPDGSCRPAF